MQPNVTCLLFTENESSFLVGVAAALATKTKNVGFIGGVNEPLIQKFQAGFQAGRARPINKSIKVQVKYLTQPPDFGGFNDPAKGKTAALGMYDNGADVVYHAAGGSGAGCSTPPSRTTSWRSASTPTSTRRRRPTRRALILTSALKGVDTAVFNFIKPRRRRASSRPASSASA